LSLSISFLISNLNFGGAERVVLNLAHAFKEKGHDVSVLLLQYQGEFLKEAEYNFKIKHFSNTRTWKLPFKLIRYLKNNECDLLISSFWQLNLCASVTGVFFPRMSVYLWEHCPPGKVSIWPNWQYALLTSFFYRFSTKIIAVSEEVYDSILSLTIGLKGKMCVIFNPITPPPKDFIRPTLSESRFKIIWVGRMEELKNPKLLIDAFNLLSDKEDYSVYFIGDGPLRIRLESYVKNNGLTNYIKFKGFTTFPYYWMNKANLLILTSDYEGFGNVLVEGLNCGLDIISTDCGKGILTILQGGRFGEIIPIRNEVLLSNAIIRARKLPRNSEDQMQGSHFYYPEIIANQFLALIDFKINLDK
jgi:glycosyltransferase involved in cell wall biosynthesis